MFVVRRGIRIWGTIVSPEPLRIEGFVDGCVVSDLIEVAFEATTRGDIVGETVVINGTVIGDVYADKLTLARGCYVEGDIFHAELQLESGATFEGKSRRYNDPRSLAPPWEETEDSGAVSEGG